MKDFDDKWQTCAAQARRTPPRDDAPPFGFAARVVALASEQKSPTVEDVWGWLSMRLLSAAFLVLILCAILEAPHLRGPRPLEPGIENAVAQIVWRL